MVVALLYTCIGIEIGIKIGRYRAEAGAETQRYILLAYLSGLADCGSLVYLVQIFVLHKKIF